jgi:hypothetical protein
MLYIPNNAYDENDYVHNIIITRTHTHTNARVGNNKRIIGYRSYCMRTGSDNPRKRRAFIYTKPLTDGRSDGKGARAQTQGFYAYVLLLLLYSVSVSVAVYCLGADATDTCS